MCISQLIIVDKKKSFFFLNTVSLPNSFISSIIVYLTLSFGSLDHLFKFFDMLN